MGASENSQDFVQLENEPPVFTLMAPSEPVEPPGGRHEGAAVKMRVPTLGSVRCPVASAPAPVAVGTWTRISGHGPSEMFIFARVYKVFHYAPGHNENVDFPMVFHGFRGCLCESGHFAMEIANVC